jgi:hypothetical protein
MPTATDLVTDLPADFEVFGQAVDTRLKALQPGTTLGDLAYSSATANTNTRLGIGTTGQVLTVAAGVPSWATTAASGGMTLIATGTGTGSSATITFSSIPGTYKHLCLVLQEMRTATGNVTFSFNYNGSAADYDYRWAIDALDSTAATEIFAGKTIANTDSSGSFSNGNYWIYDYSGAQTNKTATGIFSYTNSGGAPASTRVGTGRWRNTSAITSIAIGNSGGSNFGTSTVIKLYGVS